MDSLSAFRLLGAGRVSPRRATHFLLLRQEKVSKEKATPLSASPAAPGQPVVLGSNGVWLKLALRAQTVASPDPLLPALLGAARRGWGESRAIASLGVGAMQLVAACAMSTGAKPPFHPQPCRAQRWHVWFPRRHAESSSAGQGGKRGARCLSRRRVCAPPALAEQRSEPFAQRRADASGSPFLCFVSFGEAKEMKAAAGPRPGLQHAAVPHRGNQ